jgi:hypothetical protein
MPSVELRQVVRYSGPTREAAHARARDDQALAAAAGFAPTGEVCWDPRRGRPTLRVAYRWDPPPTLERRVTALVFHIRERVALDAGELAFAGYVLESQRVVRNVHVDTGWPATAMLDYRYDPELAGDPVAPIPPVSGDPSETWLPVRHHLRAVQVPPGRTAMDRLLAARRALLRAIGAPPAAIGGTDRGR